MRYGSVPGAPIDYETAYQNNGDLWTLGTAGYTNWNVGVAANTSPSITQVPYGYEVAVHECSGVLMTFGTDGNYDWNAGMASGTSPSIAQVSNGYEAAINANTGVLYTVGSAGDTNWATTPIQPGTSPSMS